MTAVASSQLPRVVIVGRPNVGKSSLFNRILGERRAIIEDEPGTTRDRLEADVEWMDVPFRIVDTGGYETDAENQYAALIVEQIRTAMAGAELVLLCIDARDGLTASDYDIADVVRRSQKPVLVVGTKVDNEGREAAAIADATSLGFGEPIPVSAFHDINVGVMLDEVISRLPTAPVIAESDRVRIAIIGRPNVGKSTLVNALLGEQRVIVSDVAGTTRDAIDTDVDAPEGKFTLIDTAGIRKPGKRGKGVERHSVMRATGAVERADIAILVIDGEEGLTAQDAHIAGIAVDASRGLVIAVNKTDVWGEEHEKQHHRMGRHLRYRFRFVPWAMLAFVSAAEGEGLHDLLRIAAEARAARRRRVPTPEVNTILRRAMREHMPPVIHSRRLKLRYVTQVTVDPPTFVLFVNDPALVHFSYRRFLERTIRESFDFEGTAIRLVFRAGNEDETPE